MHVFTHALIDDYEKLEAWYRLQNFDLDFESPDAQMFHFLRVIYTHKKRDKDALTNFIVQMWNMWRKVDLQIDQNVEIQTRKQEMYEGKRVDMDFANLKYEDRGNEYD